MFRNLKTKFAKVALAVLALQLAFVGVGAGATQAVAEVSPISVTAENFNTHKAADYNGVSVGYKLEGVDVAKVASVNVSLFDVLGNKMVENNSKSADKVNTAKQYSSAFIVIPGTYSTSSTWDFGTWSPAATTTVEPAKAVITVTDINGFVYTAENTLFQAIAPSHPTWANLFNDVSVTAENFNTHKAADYNGVSVGYKLEGVDVAKVASVNVSLFDVLGNKMVENNSKSADKVNTAKQYSSAFIVIPGTYSTSSTWDFGTWSPAATTTVEPAKAVITVTDINGFVYTAENTLFQAIAPSHPTWASLFNDITAIDAISGTPKVGEILTAGAVTPITATVVYQWQSSVNGLNYVDIVGANAEQFTLTSDEVGKLIRVIASGTVLYTGTVKSVPTTAVQAIAVAPAAVTGVTTLVDASGHVTISWTNPPAGTFTGIRVYRVGEFYVDLDPTATTFTDLTAEKGKTYQYVVMVIGENGVTTSSPQITVAVPAAVVASAVSDSYYPESNEVVDEVKANADKMDLPAATDTEEDGFPTWGIILLIILAAVGAYLIWSQDPKPAAKTQGTKTKSTPKTKK